MIGMIAAVSNNGIIGVDNKIPWNHPADMKYFRETTKESTVVFGRKTFESIGRPLPKRRNIVVSSTRVEMEGIETFRTLGQVIDDSHKTIGRFLPAENSGLTVHNGNIWLAGGASIYQEGMYYADEIHLTVINDIVISSPSAIRFPFINPRLFEIKEWRQLTPGDDTLRLYIYKRV
jgi:dihydrofolate reductase